MMRKKPKIIFLVGSDLIAHREMGPSIERAIELGFEPVIYYPEHLPLSNPNASHQAFKDYAYVERLILNETVYPFLEANPSTDAPFLTPKQLCKKYGLRKPIAVRNINDPAFFENIPGFNEVIGTISLRCTQILKPDITAYLKQKGRFLINLHSGLLPEFRGLYATAWAIYETLTSPEKNHEFGCTLHHIDPSTAVKNDSSTRYAGIDTGNIIDIKSRNVDASQSVYGTNIILSSMGAKAVIDTLDSIANGNTLRGYPQDHSKGRYLPLASSQELEQWKRAGVVMFERNEVARILVETFSVPGTKHAEDLEHLIYEALNSRLAPESYMSRPKPSNERTEDSLTAASRTFMQAVIANNNRDGRKVEKRKKIGSLKLGNLTA